MPLSSYLESQGPQTCWNWERGGQGALAQVKASDCPEGHRKPREALRRGVCSALWGVWGGGASPALQGKMNRLGSGGDGRKWLNLAVLWLKDRAIKIFLADWF